MPMMPIINSSNSGGGGCESNPSISLPLLLGLSKSTGCSAKKFKGANNNNNDNNDKRKKGIHDDAIINNSINDSDEAVMDAKENAASSNFKAGDLSTPASNKSPSSSSSLPKNQQTNKIKTNSNNSFPIQLHHLLNQPSYTDKYQHLISWMAHGRAFKIHMEEEFVGQILMGGFFVCSNSNDDGENNNNAENDENADDDNNHVAEHVETQRDNLIQASSSIDTLDKFHQELLAHGFHQFQSDKSHLDYGSYYHPEFVRGGVCDEDDIEKKVVRCSSRRRDELKKEAEGRGDKKNANLDDDEDEKDTEMKDTRAAATSSSPSQQQQQQQQHEASEEVSNFLAFTNTTNPTIAQQYLDMAGQNLEMAVSLFMDHGLTGGGIGMMGGGGVSALLDGGLHHSDGGGAEDEEEEGKGGEHDSEEDQVEPDFYALPFMPPLPVQKKERSILPAERIVESALNEYWAFRTVRRALLRWICHRRASKQRSTAQSCTAMVVSVFIFAIVHDAQSTINCLVEDRAVTYFLNNNSLSLFNVLLTMYSSFIVYCNSLPPLYIVAS